MIRGCFEFRSAGHYPWHAKAIAGKTLLIAMLNQ